MLMDTLDRAECSGQNTNSITERLINLDYFLSSSSEFLNFLLQHIDTYSLSSSITFGTFVALLEIYGRTRGIEI